MRDAHTEVEGPDGDERASMIEESVVDIVISLASLEYEYDIDIATALEERIELTQSVTAFENEVDEDMSIDEMEAIAENHFDDEQVEAMFSMGGVDVGDNVDRDDYDAEGEDRAYF